MMRHAFSVIGLSLFWACTAHGFISTGESLEWLCTFHPTVAHAEVISVAGVEVKDIGSIHWESGEITCKVLESLKGKAKDRLTFRYSAYMHLGKPGTKYLLFLDEDESRWPPSKEPVVVYAINLDDPAVKGSFGIACTKSGDILCTAKEILGLAKERIAANSKRHFPQPSGQIDHPARALSIEAPGVAGQALFAGSSTYLLVPPDPEFKADFLKRFRTAEDMYDQLEALCTLSYYLDDPEVAATVKGALADPVTITGTLRADPLGHPAAEAIAC